MASIPVVFEIGHAETKMGQAVAVVGSHPGMGNWQPGSESCRLSTSHLAYPRWIMATPLWMEGSNTMKFEYKYVRIYSSARYDWEDGKNRKVELGPIPAGSDVWVIKDKEWGKTHLQPTVEPRSMEELISSRNQARARPVVPRLQMPDFPHTADRKGGKAKCADFPEPREGSTASSEFGEASEDSSETTPNEIRCRRRVAACTLQQLEAAFGHAAEAELEILRRENAALRAVLRGLAAGDLQVAEQRTKERHIVLRTASLLPEEVWSFAFASAELSPTPECSYAEAWRERNEELCCAQTTEEGFHWDWPLSRCERKQRLLLAENRLQALEGQELLEELVQENAAERHELAEIMKVLKKQVAKTRKGFPADKENFMAQRGGG